MEAKKEVHVLERSSVLRGDAHEEWFAACLELSSSGRHLLSEDVSSEMQVRTASGKN